MTVQGITLPAHIHLGISPLSWTNDVLEYLGGDIELETCLSEAAGFGFEGIELGRKFPRDTPTLRATLAPHGLSLISGWWSGFLAERSVDEEMVAVAAHARLLSENEASVMVYGECALMPGTAPLDEPLSRTPKLTGKAFDDYTVKMTDFGNRLQQSWGLTLAYHHHLMMVVETWDEIRAFFDQTGPSVGLLLDTGHAAAAGFDYHLMLNRYADRIVHIHLKDVRGDILDKVRDEDLSFNEAVKHGMFATPGQGQMDFEPIADFVRESDYQGWMVIEAEQDPQIAPPKEAITTGLNHLRDLFGSSKGRD